MPELLQELKQLREEVAALKAEVSELRIHNQLIQKDLQDAKIFTLQTKIEDHGGWLADHDKAISKLMGVKEPGKVTDSRLKRTDNILLKRRNEPVSFSEMGKLQEWPKATRRQNMTHLGHLYEQLSDRYEVRDSKLGGKMVRLIPAYYKHLSIGGV